jgi:hypothetical protein
VTRVTAVSLGRVLRTLSALARGALISRARTTGLGSQGGGAWSTALVVTGRLQRVIVESLLTALLLTIRALVEVTRSAESIGNGTKSSGAGSSARVLRGSRSRTTVVAESSAHTATALVHRGRAEASRVGRGRRMLVKRSLRTVMMGLTIHALPERTVACSSLPITTELVHVVSVVWAAVVRMVVWVACTVALLSMLLRVLALGSVSLTTHGTRVGRVVSAVRGIVVSALRLYMR